MLPVYVPALRPAVETDTERVDGAVPEAVPEAEATLSHDPFDAALATAVHARVPLPLFAICID
jgi:hypothetical protein